MSVQVKAPRSSLPRHLRDVAENARRAAQSKVSKASNPTQEERIAAAIEREAKKAVSHEHGSRIYVWHHLLKDHVVYSLGKTMKNNAALSQMPFNGKKTVPRALRKDHWSPLAMVQFPAGQSSLGLTAFRKLREYRRRHELEWGDEIRYKSEAAQILAQKEEGKKRTTESVRERGRKICDQKANSIADLAAVLREVQGEPLVGSKEKRTPGIVREEPRKLVRKGWPRGEPKPADWGPDRGWYFADDVEKKEVDSEEVKIQARKRPVVDGEEQEETASPIVYWRNIEDAQFAKKWSDVVEHSELKFLGKDGLVDPDLLVPDGPEVEEPEVPEGVEGEEGATKPKVEGEGSAGEIKAEVPKTETETKPEAEVEAPKAEVAPQEAPAPKPKSFLGRLFSSLK